MLLVSVGSFVAVLELPHSLSWRQLTLSSAARKQFNRRFLRSFSIQTNAEANDATENKASVSVGSFVAVLELPHSLSWRQLTVQKYFDCRPPLMHLRHSRPRPENNLIAVSCALFPFRPTPRPTMRRRDGLRLGLWDTDAARFCR
jgi:hypothetical protein